MTFWVRTIWFETPIDLFLFVPALVGIEIEPERRGEHLRRELLGVVPGDILALAEAVVLREVPVQLAVTRDGHADGRRDQPVRLTRRRLGHDDEGDLSVLQALDTLRARQNAAFGGKMLDTRTRLHAAMPADRNASSNEVSFSRCLPTPFVKNISFGTNPATCPLLVDRGKLDTKQHSTGCQGTASPSAAPMRHN